MHKVFISYHHERDQDYKNALSKLAGGYGIFIDGSVDTGDIADTLSDQSIRQKIRDEYLQDTTVTILLVGLETQRRKHIDWEIYSSMYDGQKNKRSGIVVINTPDVGENYYQATHQNEKLALYPYCNSWTEVGSKAQYQERFPFMPSRIIENMNNQSVQISVTNWNVIATNPAGLELMIDNAFNARLTNQYDLSTAMRRSNS